MATRDTGGQQRATRTREETDEVEASVDTEVAERHKEMSEDVDSILDDVENDEGIEIIDEDDPDQLPFELQLNGTAASDPVIDKPFVADKPGLYLFHHRAKRCKIDNRICEGRHHASEPAEQVDVTQNAFRQRQPVASVPCIHHLSLE